MLYVHFRVQSELSLITAAKVSSVAAADHVKNGEETHIHTFLSVVVAVKTLLIDMERQMSIHYVYCLQKLLNIPASSLIYRR